MCFKRDGKVAQSATFFFVFLLSIPPAFTSSTRRRSFEISRKISHHVKQLVLVFLPHIGRFCVHGKAVEPMFCKERPRRNALVAPPTPQSRSPRTTKLMLPLPTLSTSNYDRQSVKTSDEQQRRARTAEAAGTEQRVVSFKGHRSVAFSSAWTFPSCSSSTAPALTAGVYGASERSCGSHRVVVFTAVQHDGTTYIR